VRYIFAITGLLLIGCSSNAQQKTTSLDGHNQVIQEGMIITLDGINLEKFKIDYKELEALEDFGINLDSLSKDHLLCFAVDQCDLELLTFLIDEGADANSKCDRDDAITYVAYCIQGGVEMTKIMIANGANKNSADQDNDSYLSYAISYDNHELVKYLVEIDANRKQKDINPNMGCLPIHGCQSLEMLKLLMAYGFEVNAICENGRNLLHFAAKDGLVEMARYLVKNNLVDIELKDKNGETPLDYAVRFGNSEIENIIKARK